PIAARLLSLPGALRTTTGTLSISALSDIQIAATIMTTGGAVNLQSTAGGISLTTAVSTSGGNITVQAQKDIVFSGPAALLDAGSGTVTVSTSGDVLTASGNVSTSKNRAAFDSGQFDIVGSAATFTLASARFLSVYTKVQRLDVIDAA